MLAELKFGCILAPWTTHKCPARCFRQVSFTLTTKQFSWEWQPALKLLAELRKLWQFRLVSWLPVKPLEYGQTLRESSGLNWHQARTHRLYTRNNNQRQTDKGLNRSLAFQSTKAQTQWLLFLLFSLQFLCLTMTSCGSWRRLRAAPWVVWFALSNHVGTALPMRLCALPTSPTLMACAKLELETSLCARGLTWPGFHSLKTSKTLKGSWQYEESPSGLFFCLNFLALVFLKSLRYCHQKFR